MKGVTGIILAGGKSHRMGEDKSFILFFGIPLIETIVDKLSSIFDGLMIITNNPDPYKKYGIKTEPDIMKDCGPLGGIYTGLVKSSSFYNFFVACDMPFLNINFIKFMSGFKGYDVVMPKYNNRLEPLCAIYSKACINPIEKGLFSNSLKITDFFQYVKVKTIGEGKIARFDSGLMFTNVNTWGDYDKLTNKVEP